MFLFLFSFVFLFANAPLPSRPEPTSELHFHMRQCDDMPPQRPQWPQWPQQLDNVTMWGGDDANSWGPSECVTWAPRYVFLLFALFTHTSPLQHVYGPNDAFWHVVWAYGMCFFLFSLFFVYFISLLITTLSDHQKLAQYQQHGQFTTTTCDHECQHVAPQMSPNRASIVWARYFFQFNFMFCSLILTLSLRILWGGFV